MYEEETMVHDSELDEVLDMDDEEMGDEESSDDDGDEDEE
jgi:hypothetical protein